MKTIKHFLAILLCISLCAPLTQAQPASDKQDAQTTNSIAQDVLIIIQQEQVRFSSQKTVAEMQLQIFDQVGQVVYDSGVVAGPELTWVLRQADGEAVKSGLYAYALSIKEVGKEAGAETARVRRGHFIVDRAKERDGQTDRLWITSQNEGGVGTELTVARNEGETVAGTSVTSERKSASAEGGTSRDGEAESKKENNVTAAPTGANGTTGRIAKFTSSTDLGNSVMTELNGNIGIGTTNPTSKLEIAAQDGLKINGYQPFLTLRDTNAGGRRAAIQGANGDLIFSPQSFIGQPPWAAMIVRDSANAGSRVDIYAQDALNMVGYQPFLTLTDSNAGWARARIQNVNGGLNFQTHYLTQVGGSAMYIQNGTQNVGIGTAAPQARLHVQGTTMTDVLQITGGADFAENFEVNVAAASEAMTAKVEAGMVVSIDPASPGKLQLSAQPFDRRVAGIISGAGGVKPGMVMSQEGTLAHGKHPVALSGRVYCWVDAAQGAVEPGDLLTTSSTPGHAMKAADAGRAQGAIIGKAMTGLKEGKGLVLVLVNLQ
ncbi:MAG: hypothetical protein ACREEM_43610 [Blastocatellia bacterium]